MIKMGKKIRGEIRRKIYEIIKKKKKVSLKELRASTQINYNTIRSTVISLTKAGLIKRVDKGLYEAK